MSAHPDPTTYEPRRGNGCIYGCLAVLLIAALPVVLAAGYGSWFLYRGLNDDPVVQLARDLVVRDGITSQVLGAPVHITGIRGNAWSWVPGASATSTYVLTLSGAHADGTLEIRSHAGSGGPTLDSATLTVPGGLRYDLLRHHALPGGRNLGDTI